MKSQPHVDAVTRTISTPTPTVPGAVTSSAASAATSLTQHRDTEQSGIGLTNGFATNHGCSPRSSPRENGSVSSNNTAGDATRRTDSPCPLLVATSDDRITPPTSSVRPSSATGSEDSPNERLASDKRVSGGDSNGSDSAGRSVSPGKQLNKLKRFLATLRHLGADISPEIGDSVHALVLALVNDVTTIEEFHDQLHKTTNFPLRPFVVPFLKSSLPILQAEIKEQARLSRMSPRLFLSKNEHILFDVLPGQASSESSGVHDLSSTSPLNEHGKRRRFSDEDETGRHNGDSSRATKYPRLLSPVGDTGAGGLYSYGLGVGPIRLQDITSSRLIREQLERNRLLQERDRYFSVYSFHRPESDLDSFDRRDSDWKYLENILQCIAGMVEKCKRALHSLQDRSARGREDVPLSLRRRTFDGLSSTTSGGEAIDIKHDIFAASIRHLDSDHRLELIRKAEEAVQDVKRQAVSELQKAVAAAETKANEILAADRLKMERTLEEVRQRTRDEVTLMLGRQEDSKENCWNCGRLASETCSGCNEARYCGAFCQHRHWETHHRTCRRNLLLTSSASSLITTLNGSRTAPANITSLLSAAANSSAVNGQKHLGYSPLLSSIIPPRLPSHASTRSVVDSAHSAAAVLQTGSGSAVSPGTKDVLIPTIKQEKV